MMSFLPSICDLLVNKDNSKTFKMASYKDILNKSAGSIVVSMSAFHADDPGSTPGWRIL